MGGESRQSDDDLLAANLKLLRERAAMSQAALAAAMTERGHPWHQSTVTRIERGTQQLKGGELVALGAILGVSIDRFTWTSPEAFGTDLIQQTARKVRQSARSLADAVAHHLGVLAAARHTLEHTEESPWPRVQEARGALARDIGLYDVDGAVAEGKRRFKEEAGDDGADPQGEPGVDGQQ
jgi:transcriptional regulator with XRE-family HTH domain